MPFKILRKQRLNDQMTRMEFDAPLIARKAKPGQFVILRVNEYGERFPLTVAGTDVVTGGVTVIFQVIGKSTKALDALEEGGEILDVVGPLGRPSELSGYGRAVVIGGGLGCAIALPQAKGLKAEGAQVDCIVGFRTKDLIILEDDFRAACDNLILMTDDGSNGNAGFVTDALRKNLESGVHYDVAIAIGPMPMMKAVCDLTRGYGLKTIVSMNALMVDGTGMCGCCRVTVGGEIKFACVDGPDFDGHLIDFDEAIQRSRIYTKEEREGKSCRLTGEPCRVPDMPPEEPPSDAGNRRNLSLTQCPMPEQPAETRAGNFDEVALGYTARMAMEEARRCLDCKNKPCMDGCPVHVDIPGFITRIAAGDFEEAYRILTDTNSLPAICGRVCPQETQCEEKCVRGIKGASVAIGHLERFAADWHRAHSGASQPAAAPKGKRVAVIGSGPAGLTCAGDLAKLGYAVTIFEAFHTPGGVLVYGIPEFRLPKEIVTYEISGLAAMGVTIQTDMVIGKTQSVDDLFADGFAAVFISSGAGLPGFLHIPGEGSVGVYSANEFLTRINLMKAYRPDYDTPILDIRRAAVIGGGNVAMDAARCARRMGAEETLIVYRRSEAEMPARREEIGHAKEEGIAFHLLSNPVRINADESGRVQSLTCAKMELGEPDASGRRSPRAIPGSEYDIEADTVIVAIGGSPNPLIRQTTPGVETNRKGCFVVDDQLQTTRPGVFAGGDAVTGAATVILACGMGKTAARSIDAYIRTGARH